MYNLPHTNSDEEEYLKSNEERNIIFITIRVKLGLIVWIKLRLIVQIKLGLEL